MRARVGSSRRTFGLAGPVLALMIVGCRAPANRSAEFEVRDAVERYAAVRSDQLARDAAQPSRSSPSSACYGGVELPPAAHCDGTTDAATAIYLLGTYGADQPTTTSAPVATQPAVARPPGAAPEGYWRQDIWHQMGHEALEMGKRDFWRGFKVSFWDAENAAILAATMGASITIRETGVDDTIAGRIKGHRQLGDADEPIQILGNPATHFAAAGVLWLGTGLTKDFKGHEFSRALANALAVNGLSTELLKVATNTSAPNGDRYAWPSGHTSSAFTVAAVVNEYYGPWAGIPALGLAGLVGYQRLDSRVHDFSDVVFGGMMGYVIGTSIARDEKMQFPEVLGMKVIPYVDPNSGSSGLALWKQF